MPRATHLLLSRASLSLAFLTATACGSPAPSTDAGSRSDGDPHTDADLHGDAGSVPVGAGKLCVGAPTADAGPAACHSLPVAAVYTPRAARPLSVFPLLLVSEDPSACACDPVPQVDLTTAVVAMSACNCTSRCACDGTGYDATQGIGANEGAPHGVEIILAYDPRATTTIVDESACTDITYDDVSLTPLAPVAGHWQSPHRPGWVMLHASSARCCGEPLPLVTTTTAADGSIALSVRECRPDPCDCTNPTAHDASTPVYVGELPSGTTTITFGAATTTLSVEPAS